MQIDFAITAAWSKDGQSLGLTPRVPNTARRENRWSSFSFPAAGTTVPPDEAFGCRIKAQIISIPVKRRLPSSPSSHFAPPVQSRRLLLRRLFNPTSFSGLLLCSFCARSCSLIGHSVFLPPLLRRGASDGMWRWAAADFGAFRAAQAGQTGPGAAATSRPMASCQGFLEQTRKLFFSVSISCFAAAEIQRLRRT